MLRCRWAGSLGIWAIRFYGLPVLTMAHCFSQARWVIEQEGADELRQLMWQKRRSMRLRVVGASPVVWTSMAVNQTRGLDLVLGSGPLAGEAPLSATGLRSDFRTPFSGSTN